MLTFLPDELLLMISQHLNVKDFLNFARTTQRNNLLSHDYQNFRSRIRSLGVTTRVGENKHEYIAYCKSRVARIRQEVSFLENKKEDVLNLLNNTLRERIYLISLFKKIQKCATHLEETGQEKYILDADSMLNALNGRLIHRQIANVNQAYLKLTCITRIPEQVISENKDKFESLKGLELKDNCLETVPDSIAICQALSSLNLYGNPITYLPPAIGHINSLEYFYMSDGYLPCLPSCFFQLINLKWVALDNMQLKALSPAIKNLQQLTWLYIENNQLDSLPLELAQLEKLTEIFLNRNHLQAQQPKLISQYLRSRGITTRQLLQMQSQSSQSPATQYLEDSIPSTPSEHRLTYFTDMKNAKSKHNQLEALDLDMDTLCRKMAKLQLK